MREKEKRRKAKITEQLKGRIANALISVSRAS